MSEEKVAVVMPCYRVGTAVLEVIAAIGPQAGAVYVVDDACPEGTGDMVEARCTDPRVRVLRHTRNTGVGGAVITGYRQALADGWTVVAKIDGDGQMDPRHLPQFVKPLLEGKADYTKGNRFFRIESVQGMPLARLVGNAVLSFMAKASSGYWRNFDPTNGYTAIHAGVLRTLPLDKIAHDYFFETDMLFRLNTMGAVVRDVPMDSVYAGERSSMHIPRIIPRFLGRHAVNFAKRIVYNYFLRDFQLASLALLLGVPLLLFGVGYGLGAWIAAAAEDRVATAGTVMLAALPTLTGMQLLLLFASHDISAQPRDPIQQTLD